MKTVRSTKTRSYSLRDATVQRLDAWLAKQPVKQNASAIMDVAISNWLDENDG
jgi:hypothetical protein